MSEENKQVILLMIIAIIGLMTGKIIADNQEQTCTPNIDEANKILKHFETPMYKEQIINDLITKYNNSEHKDEILTMIMNNICKDHTNINYTLIDSVFT